MRRIVSGAAWAALLAIPLAADAASIASVTPQGEVAQVRQVTVKFSEPVVPFGDLRQPDPMAIACEGATPAGTGRWSTDRVWLFDFREPLPPGKRCTVKARAEWKPLGGALAGTTAFRFSTGGPAVLSIQPSGGSTIEEDQHFIVQLTGPATDASVASAARCEVDGIGEGIPVRLVDGRPREELLRARRLEKNAARTLVLACQRPLPNDVRVRLVWGRGIASADNPAVTTSVDQRWDFRSRKPFTAEFSCERENAGAPCLPIRPMSLRFSEPITRVTAEQVRLKPASGAALAPVFDKDDKASEVQDLRFPVPLPENARFTIELPRDVRDGAGRALANAASFPLAVATGAAPPIAKFAAAPFGVVEWDGSALLPVTLRHVQGDLRAKAAGGSVRIKRIDNGPDMLTTYQQLRRYHESSISAREAGLPESQWWTIVDEPDARGHVSKRRVENVLGTREVSLLAKDSAAKALALPQLEGGDPRPFEVVGIPLDRPGYHVVEIESQRLGASLLDKKAPVFVRTGVLVTNLGVHLKLGRENSLLWVTTLDRGRPVEGADVAVHDCTGLRLWKGKTDKDGLARADKAFDANAQSCPFGEGLFAVASKETAKGVVDTAFVMSQWTRGIEPWRFNVPTAQGPEPEWRAHTVFDRTLLRAGETVSMKHLVRRETGRGLAQVKPAELPTRMKIVHDGTGQEFVQPLSWAANGSAVSTWNIPAAAKLGSYRVVLEREGGNPALRRSFASGEFRVEEFRVPLVDVRLAGPKGAVVAAKEVAVDVQMNHFSGGAMAQAPLRASALLRPRTVAFEAWEEYSFEPPTDPNAAPSGDDAEDRQPAGGRLVADKLPLVTDRQGAAQLLLKDLPRIDHAGEVLAEVTFNDPNGEVQTAATTIPVWPSALVLGIKSGSWASNRGQVKFSVLALDTAGKPIQGQRAEVRGRVTQTISTRKRMVGGFYAYDNRTEVTDLGSLCTGTTDDRGLLLCEATLSAAGQVDLIAQGQDSAGNAVQAATSVWVTKQGELWFAQDNDDRIDVLPEKKRYEPGETAKLQVRMPYREATALVAVEREGVIDTRLVKLRGDDPTIELTIDKAWAPNVYVSVLALRGRIREVPWYSFFTWGWKEPLEWVRSFWYEGREYQAPTAMVDLAKPSFKLGVAALKVGIAEHELQVTVKADRPQYAVRDKASVRVKVAQGGKPLAGTEVAFAAVDEGLLALRGNDSWDLLGAMIKPRAWGVQTSTAQSEIIGRRHYGRKALAAGGGGGRGNTRELFDTLLLWNPRVVLDANGEAVIQVPLNDSLTSFRLVAVADAGPQKFGTGSTSIRVTQDLQVLAGVPPLVRQGDRFVAMLTVRNTTEREMKISVALQGTAASGSEITRTPLNFPAQEIVLTPGSAQEVSWPVDVPADAYSIAWEALATEQAGPKAKDRVKITQLVADAVPLRVLQATLMQLDGSFSLPVAAPADALPEAGLKRGGLAVGLQPKLTGALPGIRRYFETYPFICLEQKTSKAVGLKDAQLWSGVANTLPTYLDADGLANYFPPRAEDGARGSDRLTAYVLAATHEAGFELPVTARDRMLDGLAAFVEGRIERRFWSPKPDLDVRKIAALEALARYGRAQPKMLGSVNLTPTLWPTAAVIDWLSLLRRIEGVPEQAKRIDEAQQVLRSRLTYAGTTLKFSREDDDFWWWLMDSPDANAAKLILVTLDDPAWKEDLPRMVVGSLARQQRGAWLTTTANLWGSLALDKFALKFESEKITGKSVAGTGTGKALAIDWAAQPDGGRVQLPWPEKPATLSVEQQGKGRPWVTVQSIAAIPLKAPLRAGYSVVRRIAPVEQKDAGKWSRGDVMRVTLDIDAQSDMTWVVLSDPVPGGATILGSGLGRDSQIATRTERRAGSAWAAFEERSFEAFRSYYEYLPRGKHTVEYTVRLNNAGRFLLPPTRVEAMYAPESFGESPNEALEVLP